MYICSSSTPTYSSLSNGSGIEASTGFGSGCSVGLGCWVGSGCWVGLGYGVLALGCVGTSRGGSSRGITHKRC